LSIKKSKGKPYVPNSLPKTDKLKDIELAKKEYDQVQRGKKDFDFIKRGLALRD